MKSRQGSTKSTKSKKSKESSSSEDSSDDSSSSSDSSSDSGNDSEVISHVDESWDMNHVIFLDSNSKTIVKQQPKPNLGATGGFADDDQTILNHLMSGK